MSGYKGEARVKGYVEAILGDILRCSTWNMNKHGEHPSNCFDFLEHLIFSDLFVTANGLIIFRVCWINLNPNLNSNLSFPLKNRFLNCWMNVHLFIHFCKLNDTRIVNLQKHVLSSLKSPKDPKNVFLCIRLTRQNNKFKTANPTNSILSLTLPPAWRTRGKTSE